MKKIMLSLLMLAPVVAFANLGDTRADSANRYGKPVLVRGNFVDYHSKGWMITEWFDQAGYAEVISYSKGNGNVTAKENSSFFVVNIPAGHPLSEWLEQDSSVAGSRIFISLDQAWFYESGSVKLGKYWFDTRTLGTAAGVNAMMADDSGHDSSGTTQNVSTTENPLPL